MHRQRLFFMLVSFIFRGCNRSRDLEFPGSGQRRNAR